MPRIRQLKEVPRSCAAVYLAASLFVGACVVNRAPILVVTPTAAAPAQATAVESAQPEPPTIYFYGDSISSGRGFGDEDYPSVLNGIHGIANILLAANCASGAQVENDRGQDFNGLYADASEGDFQPGDFILWTNAGPTINDSEMYVKWMELVTFAAQGKAPIILTTTYDHGGISDYNAPLASGQSLNDAVRKYTQDNGILLLDWDRLLRHSEERTAPFGGSLLFDGIHPGPFGNFAMAAALLRFLHVEVTDLDNLPELFLQDSGDVPDLSGPLFHWGYNPDGRQRRALLDGLLEDVETIIQPGLEAIDCG